MRLRICLIVCLFATMPAWAQGKPLASLLDVYRVDKQVLGDGQLEEQLVSVEEAISGDTLEYVFSYKNVSEQVLSGFVIKNKIPEKTEFLPGSNSANIDSELLVSIDNGASWDTLPVTRVVADSGGEPRTIVIPPEQFTHISWRIAGGLPPEGEFELRYRVVVQ